MVDRVAGLTIDSVRWMAPNGSAPYRPTSETMQIAHFFPTTFSTPRGGHGQTRAVGSDSLPADVASPYERYEI